MPVLRWLYRHILNSVPLGIALLVLIGLYISIGSGVTGLREWLEMDELLFFNWWPFKLLIVALVVNLTIVTVSRIPLTPPRYGVWMIHLGIILLCVSLGAHYRLKVEGMVPLIKGQTATSFYDRWERALYVRTPKSVDAVRLDGLPRFGLFDEQSARTSMLDRPALKGIEPRVQVWDQSVGQSQAMSLAQAIGAANPVRLDVVGYYPYARPAGWTVGPESNSAGLKITGPAGEAAWIVAGDASDSGIPLGERVYIEHRHMPTAADVQMAAAAAKLVHKLKVRVGPTQQDLSVEPGQTYEVGDYSLAIEAFQPQFPLSTGDGAADALTLQVTRKNADGSKATYRRMVLAGRDEKGDAQTDFELGADGAGPFGKRKRDGLLDANLTLSYVYSDPTKLLPSMSQITAKYILFTAVDTPGITMLRVSPFQPNVVMTSADPKVDLHVDAPASMFEAGTNQPVATLNVERVDHVKRSDAVVVVPKADRDREAAESGLRQMVRVKVSSGDWSQIVAVTFDPYALLNGVRGQSIQVPGARESFQLMLGKVMRPLPVAVRLEGFEAKPYAGAEAASNSFMRDFKSNLTFFDFETKDAATSASASLNEPAFFSRSRGLLTPGESWVFSQAGWNPDNPDFTAIQVGNRPFAKNMMLACVMIFGGLLYAFYLKPIIIRRMKANALRSAAQRKMLQGNQSHEPQELVTTA